MTVGAAGCRAAAGSTCVVIPSMESAETAAVRTPSGIFHPGHVAASPTRQRRFAEINVGACAGLRAVPANVA